MTSQVVTFDTLRTVAHGSVTSSYVALGTAFTHPVRMIRIINNTDGDMFFSLDGSTNQLFVPASSFVLYDFTANRDHIAPYFVMANGSQLYVKYSTAPTKNDVWVECVYGRGE
jgi:hypothetical protein